MVKKGFQPEKDDAKCVNGYYFAPSKMKRDSYYLREQSKAERTRNLLDRRWWNSLEPRYGTRNMVMNNRRTKNN
jgi:hypothetical protein